ncbi:conserved hypothetical protein [Culex quinquefasciatus]|uniref:CRC domain-containing protein n=1 Tax=Culex quinquefasciatus TaxID=7176 RepID=B0XL57_CULQU|nr:conserved hypothetical protein [Culex quinquefasciatus]|eukprot:XP_001870379.1 conserved hypothetical protein [Culex quinquefasciatus]
MLEKTSSATITGITDVSALGRLLPAGDCSELFGRITAGLGQSPVQPKIGATSAAEDATRRHTKGCNCKRSGCLKNYCECYEAKIACSGNCKCIGECHAEREER